MNTLTRKEITTKITDDLARPHITQTLIADILDRLLELMAQQLSTGGKIILRDFGALEVIEQKSRIGRNPKNPQKNIHVPPKAVVKFRPGKELKNRVALALPTLRERKKIHT